MKKKKSPSDCLVLPNLMIEGLHGLGLCIPFYLLDPDLIMKGQFCLQTLVFFSLVMLILMTFNRYVAAFRSLKYKLWFKKRFILVGFLGITFLTVALFMVSSYLLFFAKVVKKSVDHYCETYYKKISYYVFVTDHGHVLYQEFRRNACHPRGTFRCRNEPKLVRKLKTSWEIHEKCHKNITAHDKALLNVDYFALYLWPQFQFVLVIINTVIIYFIYRKIYNKLNVRGKFGTCTSFSNSVGDLFRDKVIPESKLLKNKLTVEAVQETNRLQTSLHSGKYSSLIRE